MSLAAASLCLMSSLKKKKKKNAHLAFFCFFHRGEYKCVGGPEMRRVEWKNHINHIRMLTHFNALTMYNTQNAAIHIICI